MINRLGGQLDVNGHRPGELKQGTGAVSSELLR